MIAEPLNGHGIIHHILIACQCHVMLNLVHYIVRRLIGETFSVVVEFIVVQER
jgi:uncharacterized membrane protein